MVTKVCILGIEAIFSHFLNKNTEKIILKSATALIR